MNNQTELAAAVRLANFNGLRKHPLLGKDFYFLNDEEQAWAINFIQEQAHLDTNGYFTVLNRLVVDDPVIRRKNRGRVWALLLEAATSEVPRPSRRN